MSTVEDRLLRLREERMAREKARIEKLRELNLKKYNNNEAQGNIPNAASTQKLVKSNSSLSKNNNGTVKNNFHVIGTTKRPITAPVTTKSAKDIKTKNVKSVHTNEVKVEAKPNPIHHCGASKINDKNAPSVNIDKKVDTKITVKSTSIINKRPNTSGNVTTRIVNRKAIDKTDNKINDKNAPITKTDNKFNEKNAPVTKSDKILTEIKPIRKIDPVLTRKSIAVFQKPANTNVTKVARTSMIPKIDSSKNHESVFERLYKPKLVTKKTVDYVEKLKTNPNYLKKVIRNSEMILKRHTCFETYETKEPPRRSISAVHFKRISKNEMGNCIHKWASIGDKLNKQHLTVDEAENIKEDKVVSAVKSERKKVKFMTPMSHLNTPRPDELQTRLKAWLQKRGKSLDAYHHLQCFGINHLNKNVKPLNEDMTPKFDHYNDENKENIALDSDSDNGSYNENMGKQNEAVSEKVEFDEWREASCVRESADFNETGDFNETTVTSTDTFPNIDDLLIGTLNDLTMLLREGFDWQQGAVYLRAIRTRYPMAPRAAPYWECRAALEEARGDLHASVQCWEEAIAKGTEHNVVEASLDTLLNKFMQLKITPTSTQRRPDPKMVDVKNVFKSTIIRFAVQQAKLRQSENPQTPMFTVTPVRRSGRLSMVPRATPHATPHDTPRSMVYATPRSTLQATPLRICETVREVASIVPSHVFTPNENLVQTP